MNISRIAVVFCWAALFAASGIPGSAQTVSVSDDADHYPSWQGSPFDALYTEWWYFNFYDAANDVQAIFSYQVLDPQNLTAHGTAMMTAVAYQGSSIVTTFDPYPLTQFAASTRVADVRVGSNLVYVASNNTYGIRGASANGRLAWDLRYDRALNSWFAGDHVPVGTQAWEQMSWLLYMPRAHVSGTLTIDGTPYSIDTFGYHDHNWGHWNITSVLWNWAQVSTSGIAFDLGDFPGNPNGRAAIAVGSSRLVFPASQYTLVHTQWAYDSVNHAYYPTQSVFAAKNGSVQLSIVMEVQKSVGIQGIPGLLLYEQTAKYRGTVSTGLTFEGVGFKEYVTKPNP